MNVDPGVKNVVFEVKSFWKRQVHVEPVPTRARDGVRTTWRAVQARTTVDPCRVRRIYSEWEPSPHDQAFVTGNLAVFLAHVTPPPRGTMGMSYVMQRSTDGSAAARDGLVERAFQNLPAGLQVRVTESDGERVFVLEHPGGLAAAALALPDLYVQARSWT